MERETERTSRCSTIVVDYNSKKVQWFCTQLRLLCIPRPGQLCKCQQGEFSSCQSWIKFEFNGNRRLGGGRGIIMTYILNPIFLALVQLLASL